jgi:hypothetical protein
MTQFFTVDLCIDVHEGGLGLCAGAREDCMTEWTCQDEKRQCQATQRST